jgi:outer membrane receptor protein involved in Fe transport
MYLLTPRWRPTYIHSMGGRQLSPAVTLNNLDLTGTGGNADLKPVRWTNVDAALEWYFAKASLLSVDVFYMDLPSYVTYGYNLRPYIDTTTNQVAYVTITSPYNVKAKNHGVEVAWQQPLWGPFGALANYTYNGRHHRPGPAARRLIQAYGQRRALLQSPWAECAGGLHVPLIVPGRPE